MTRTWNAVRPLVFVIAAGAWAAEGGTGGGEVQHRLPAVSSVFPQGSRPGEIVRVEILGQHLDRADRILFLDSGVTGKLIEVEPTRLLAEFTSMAGAKLSPHYFRVVSPRGASNAGLFRLGNQPHRNEREPNSTAESAETVAIPATINGRLETDDDYDFFRFHAGRDETLIFDLRAARNGSGLDAALILIDSRGRKLEHDEDTFVWDPFFAHRFAEEGDYVAVVQPSHTRNDPGFAYQLDIRRDAHLETVSPLALPPGAETEVTVFGQGLVNRAARVVFEDPGFVADLLGVNGTSASARVKVPADARSGPHRFAIGGSNWATLLVDAAPVHRGDGVIASFPVSITGTARYRAPDRYSFEVTAGQPLLFEVRAQRYGSPVDSVLRILDSKGKAIATNDDGKFSGVAFNKDSFIEHRFTETGTYRLEIRNLWTTTGEDFPYQISIRPPEPRVDLMLDSDNPYVFAGQKGKIKVTAARLDGFDGEIPLELIGLPEGVTASRASIPGGASEGEIEIDATGARAGIVARIDVRSQVARRPAWRAIQIASGGGEGRHYGEAEGATLAVAEQPLFSLECAATSVNLVRGGTALLKVGVTRREGFEAPLSYAALNLPPGITMEFVDEKQGEATLRFKAEGGAPTGRAARVSVSGTGGGQTQAAPKISLLVD